MPSKRPLLEHLRALRPGFAKAAQAVYDAWEQDEEGLDPELGPGGICDEIAEKIAGIVGEQVPGVSILSGGQEGDDHAWVVAARDGKAYGVDIPCRIYETGGGYSWEKIPDVTFRSEDVIIFPVPYPEEGNLEMGTSEGGTNIRGNRFEADLARNRQLADVRDRKNNRLFVILSREDLQELHDLTEKVLEMMPEE
jgi:hypothetical protein